jgi:hypothetical protein
VHATSLEEIQRYADTGAIKLALRIMDREQPALEKQPEQWMQWERQRIGLYEARQDWAALSRTPGQAAGLCHAGFYQLCARQARRGVYRQWSGRAGATGVTQPDLVGRGL